ncbi:unnamed protein product [Adineta ricciae]|uniref:Uncharacterized protein n=1 Tax=Adineta ricciae TaxID=249248 RepID=A0A813SHE6_ADIRI|nr:unnamed protein product [Adineta ricciae]
MTTVVLRTSSSSSSRSLILFVFGCTLAVVLMTFQYEHKLLLFNSPRLMLTLPSLSLISICGLSAALVGFLYPLLTTSIDQTSMTVYNDDSIQKSQICKSLVIFVGINHLCAKIPFPSDLHFSIIITLLCIAFWWYFDEILLRAGALQYTHSDFYLKTCVPCLTFAGAILTIQITKLLSHPTVITTIQIDSEHIKNE